MAVLGRSFLKGALHSSHYEVKLRNDPKIACSSVPCSQILQVFMSSFNYLRFDLSFVLFEIAFHLPSIIINFASFFRFFLGFL